MTSPGAAAGVAVLAKRGRFLVAEPAFERGGNRMTLDGKSTRGANVGDLVLLGIGKRGVRVVRKIRRPDVPRDVVEAWMLHKGLWRQFAKVVELEAEDVAANPPWDGPRKDLTSLPTFTIDPASAKDFDDAISAQREDGGRIRVWVHIADVGAYVRPGGAIDRDAFRRATSVYVPGTVEPMLPKVLSNGVCSLVPGQDRNAVTVEMEMDGADVASVSFYRSVIHSDMRLVYDEVDEIFAGSRPAEAPWAEPLDAARAVSRALAERRAQKGALEVTSSEPRFEFDERGYVVALQRESSTESHELIEHLMILANEQVAKYLDGRNAPTLYRVHEQPDPEAVDWLVERLESLGVPTPPVPKHMSPQQAGDVAGEASRLVAEHIRRTGHGSAGLSVMVLRSLKQALYSPKNLGHAGLKSTHYCHFTSPIRRYPDLIVHRALVAALGIDDVAPRKSDMDEAGMHTSDAERDAMRIERDADDICLAFLLERDLFENGWDRTWEGEVVSLIPAGAFIRFGDEGFEGMLPVRRMRGDWYELNEHETALVGADSGNVIRIGDPITVTVARVDTLRGRVDLAFPDTPG